MAQLRPSVFCTKAHIGAICNPIRDKKVGVVCGIYDMQSEIPDRNPVVLYVLVLREAYVRASLMVAGWHLPLPHSRYFFFFYYNVTLK